MGTNTCCASAPRAPHTVSKVANTTRRILLRITSLIRAYTFDIMPHIVEHGIVGVRDKHVFIFLERIGVMTEAHFVCVSDRALHLGAVVVLRIVLEELARTGDGSVVVARFEEHGSQLLQRAVGRTY